ncbi:JmjN-domain-containing protein, partial [Delitschia confertaspora ATCC 74209]
MAGFAPDAGPSMGATMTTFRVTPTNGTPATTAPKSRMGGGSFVPVNGAPTNGSQVNGGQPAGPPTIPLSARKAAPLDLSTVERRDNNPPAPPPPKTNRLFGLTEAPTFRPTAEEFKDPILYIASIREEGQKYGIVKIVPPENWNPPF